MGGGRQEENGYLRQQTCLAVVGMDYDLSGLLVSNWDTFMIMIADSQRQCLLMTPNFICKYQAEERRNENTGKKKYKRRGKGGKEEVSRATLIVHS